MNTSELDNMLNKYKFDAPPDFTNRVMKKIKTYEMERRNIPVKNGWRQAGISLVAASLIALFLNFMPMTHHINFEKLDGLISSTTIEYESISYEIEYITLKIGSLFNRPIDYLVNNIFRGGDFQ